MSKYFLQTKGNWYGWDVCSYTHTSHTHTWHTQTHVPNSHTHKCTQSFWEEITEIKIKSSVYLLLMDLKCK
jgi:hypothetical protein